MKEVLRFVACGSVDDGKSTLIGRLLYDCKAVHEDQLASLYEDSHRYGTQGARTDFALLLDGLQAEREQAITIDIAYRFFSTPVRRYVVADAPGHEQYTRNMATAASTAHAGVIVVDVHKGILPQTLRHTRILSLMGVRHVALVVNKMDLAGYERDAFERVAATYREQTCDAAFETIEAIPVSALEGENVATRGAHMPWYRGPSLIEFLDRLDATASLARPFRMPVHWVNRGGSDFRGYSGRIASGEVRAGDMVRVLPSRTTARVREVRCGSAILAAASAGDSITLTLDEAVDASRGDVLCGGDPAGIAEQFQAHVVWMSEQPLVPSRAYVMKIHAQEVRAIVTDLRFQIDVGTSAQLAARTLAQNEIGVVNISTRAPVVYEPYSENHCMGAFILIDRLTHETAGAGMIDFALRRDANIRWQSLDVDRHSRAEMKGQAPKCIWLTGLPASGKSTVANALEQRLHSLGRHTYLIDGDNVRHGLNRDLGFTEADRVENVRRVSEVARLMVDAGLIVIVALISPFRRERRQARELFNPGEFVEVFVDTPLTVCESRDPKGHYRKARLGELKNFTGIDSPYEPPEEPEVRLDAAALEPAHAAEHILAIIEGSPEKRTGGER